MFKKEFAVIIFIVLGITTFIFSLKYLGFISFKEKFYTIDVTYKDVSGIELGTIVMMNGVKIGKVSNIKLEKGYVVLSLQIKEGYKVRKGSKFSINLKGLIGDLTLSIEENINSDEFYVKGDIVQGKEPISLNLMFEKTYKMLLLGEKIDQKIQEMEKSGNQDFIKKIDTTMTKFNDVMDETSKLLKNTNSLIAENKKDINKLLDNTNILITNLNKTNSQASDFIKGTDKNINEIKKLSFDLVSNIQETLKKTNQLVENNEKSIEKSIKNMEIISGKLVAILDEAKPEEIKKTKSEIDNLIKNFSEVSNNIKNIMNEKNNESIKKTLENAKNISEKINTMTKSKISKTFLLDLETYDEGKSNLNFNAMIFKDNKEYLKLGAYNMNNSNSEFNFSIGFKNEKNRIGVGLVKGKEGIEYERKILKDLFFECLYYNFDIPDYNLILSYYIKNYKLYLDYDNEDKIKVGLGYSF